MARARLIKPQFFLDEAVASVSDKARLLFIGLWCLADREGRLEDRPRVIHVQVLPFDEVSVDGLLGELVTAKLIERYKIAENALIQIRSFTKHQHCHVKEPASTIPAPGEHRSRTRRASVKPCAGTSRAPGKPVPSPAEAEADTEADTEAVSTAPGKPRAADPFVALFAEAHEQLYDLAYPGQQHDYIQLAKLRKRYGDKLTPDRWLLAVQHYFETEMGKRSLAALCVDFAVFFKSPLDRYGKPILPIDENGKNKPRRESEEARKTRECLESIAENFRRAAAGGDQEPDSGSAEGSWVADAGG